MPNRFDFTEENPPSSAYVGANYGSKVAFTPA
jgi:hypothetical protein